MSGPFNFTWQRISLRISRQGQSVYFSSQSPKDFHLLTALCLNVRNQQAMIGSTFGLRIDEARILDESHEAHLLSFSPDVSYSERFLPLEPAVSVNCSRIEGIYTDGFMQSLLKQSTTWQTPGLIPQSTVSTRKTFVSGKESFSYSEQVSSNPEQSDSFTNAQGSTVNPRPQYPYDVSVYFLYKRN